MHFSYPEIVLKIYYLIVLKWKYCKFRYALNIVHLKTDITQYPY